MRNKSTNKNDGQLSKIPGPLGITEIELYGTNHGGLKFSATIFDFTVQV